MDKTNLVKIKLANNDFVFADNGNPVTGYGVSINNLCKMLHSSRDYIHKNVEKKIRHIILPSIKYATDIDANKSHKYVDVNVIKLRH